MSKRKNQSQPKSTNFRVSSIPEELRASVAKRKSSQSQQRVDTSTAMTRITTSGWDYNEEFAKAEGTDDVGYYISEVRKVSINPEDAHELFSNHNYLHNRGFDQSHCTHLSQSMKVAPAIDIAIGPSCKPVIVNGQHSMWAIYMRGLTTPASVTIYQCRDEKAIARLFTIFDANKKRSQQNAIDAAVGAGEFSVQIASNKLAKWSQWVAVAEADFRRMNINETNAQKMDRVKRPDVQEFAAWFDHLTKDVKTARLVTQGVGSAFYAMFASDRPRAEGFISRYVDGVDLGIDSPIRVLREKMLNRPEGEHGASVCRTHAELVYSAWRKYCLEEPMQVIRRTLALPQYNRWQVFVSPPVSSSQMSATEETVKPPTKLWGQQVTVKSA